MADKKSKKGKAYVVKHDSSAPGGDCKAKNCPIKRAIYPGMTLVEYDGKTFHANCAIYEGIEFKVPTVPKRKSVD
jgi:hypothetical protein